MSNTSDTQRIPQIHLPSSSFIDPPMDATEVGIPTLPPAPSAVTREQERTTGSTIPIKGTSPAFPIPPPPTTAMPNMLDPYNPYQCHPLPQPCYPLLWEAHRDECGTLRGTLLTMFTVFVLTMAASLSLMIFLASGIVLTVFFLMMLLMKG